MKPIAMTVEDMVATTIDSCIADERIPKSDPEWAIYSAIEEKLRTGRRVKLETRAEVEVIADELRARIETCEEIYATDGESEYRLELSRCRRSLDRLEDHLREDDR